jgi:exosortase J
VHAAAQRLFAVWRDNDLKSVGAVIPLISFALILRSWRRLGWQTRHGSWWGLVLLAITSAIVFTQDHMLLLLTIRGWLVQIPPLPLVAVAYAAAWVLLVDGRPLLREAAFPVLLLLLVIPVPQTFSNAFDLPLQHASAVVARHFAQMLGTHLTEDRLRLMFTPEYGMFIAPGCNGIRGSLVLGLVALVMGYLYRFRWFVWVPLIVGSVMTGYLFNFVRLCLLVVFYRLTLHAPWFQDRAAGADYLIGGTLFVAAIFLFIWIANRMRREPEDVLPEEPALPPATHQADRRRFYWKAGVLLAFCALAAVDTVRELRLHAQMVTEEAQAVAFPQQLGRFQLQRTWDETMIGGGLVYSWAEYAAPVDGSATSGVQVALGISPRLGMHDTTTCHMTRGDDPLDHLQLEAQTLSGPASFSATLFNTGSSLRLEAASVCQSGACQQFTDTHQHVTLVFARPTARVATSQSRPVPVLLKAETSVTNMPLDQVAAQLSGDMRAFLAHVDLAALTRPYQHD